MTEEEGFREREEDARDFSVSEMKNGVTVSIEHFISVIKTKYLPAVKSTVVNKLPLIALFFVVETFLSIQNIFSITQLLCQVMSHR